MESEIIADSGYFQFVKCLLLSLFTSHFLSFSPAASSPIKLRTNVSTTSRETHFYKHRKQDKI